MFKQKKLTVSHAPFWHNGATIAERNRAIMAAALPAVILGVIHFGISALAVLSLAVSTAILWELICNKAMKTTPTIGDSNAALIGLLLGMMLPAGLPWWVVVIATLIAIVMGKIFFGGIGATSYHPVVVAMTMLMVSWPQLVEFDTPLANTALDFPAIHPLVLLKQFGPEAADRFSILDLLMGRHVGGIGSTFGLGLIAGGLYLMARRIIRWEVTVSFIVGMGVTAQIFHMADPAQYAGPVFHLLTGYSMIGAFFLATDDSTSPVNTIPMLIYGAGIGVMTMLIRNTGNYPDGVLLAILVMNSINPLLDMIRPKALGKVA